MLSGDEVTFDQIDERYLQEEGFEFLRYAAAHTDLPERIGNASNRDDVVDAVLHTVTDTTGSMGMRHARAIATALDQYNIVVPELVEQDLLPENAENFDFNRSNVRTDAQIIQPPDIGQEQLIPSATVHYTHPSDGMHISFAYTFGQLIKNDGKDRFVHTNITDPNSPEYGMFDDQPVGNGWMIQDHDLMEQPVDNPSDNLYSVWDKMRADATAWGMINMAENYETYVSSPGLRLAYDDEAGHERDRMRKEGEFRELISHRDNISRFIDGIRKQKLIGDKAILIEGKELNPTIEPINSGRYQDASQFRN